MKLSVLGSSSKGNCYIFQASDSTLIVEAGVRLAEIKKALGFDMKKVCACVVSHTHGDHASSVAEIAAAGVRVIAPQDVFVSRRITSSLCKAARHLHGIKAGGFKILPLSVIHDVPCMAYVIEHKEMGITLFITDTASFPYAIDGINHLMVETNYDITILDDNIRRGAYPSHLRGRITESHMEIDTALSVARKTESFAMRDVILLHLSDRNSDEQLFQNRMTIATGLPVYVAHKGAEFDLTL